MLSIYRLTSNINISISFQQFLGNNNKQVFNKMSRKLNDYDRKKVWAKNAYTEKIQKRSQAWGKKKFTPAPVLQEEDPTPWKHVKNDILDDEKELRNSQRFNLDSQEAKDTMKQREVNHMRNVIEAKRNEETKWETFDDESVSISASGSLENGKQSWINPKNMGFKERNYLRAKLTRTIAHKKATGNLKEAIHDLQRSEAKMENAKKKGTFKKKTK